jgi:nicotinamide-nucleotide amidase
MRAGAPPDLSALAGSVAERLKTAKHTVAVAESSAGGLISASLLAVPGASGYFLGGGVIYTARARRGLLGLGEESMAGLRSSTEPYALLKARAVRDILGATWGLAETGASGPTGNRYGDAPGHACIAVTGPVERAITVETERADREANMWSFTHAALDLLARCMTEAAIPHPTGE